MTGLALVLTSLLSLLVGVLAGVVIAARQQAPAFRSVMRGLEVEGKITVLDVAGVDAAIQKAARR